ncbi:MAG: hypothetical protein B7Z02_17360 [Rhodobacterales bacterium 32-67-9]|nr:MAG: hypothetical protein B7Z02_17360 [Rhodobacterales bacterium 32-67-9]
MALEQIAVRPDGYRDALEASANGGRWSVPQNSTPGTSVLYTSMQRDGALAEVASYMIELTPLPRSNPLKVSTIALTASRVVRLQMGDLEALGVDRSRYGTRDYFVTQQIGAALEHLGVDGLIARSARYDCDNLMIFTTQHGFDQTLEVVSTEEVEWRDWARRRGMLKGLE